MVAGDLDPGSPNRRFCARLLRGGDGRPVWGTPERAFCRAGYAGHPGQVLPPTRSVPVAGAACGTAEPHTLPTTRVGWVGRRGPPGNIPPPGAGWLCREIGRACFCRGLPAAAAMAKAAGHTPRYRRSSRFASSSTVSSPAGLSRKARPSRWSPTWTAMRQRIFRPGSGLTAVRPEQLVEPGCESLVVVALGLFEFPAPRSGVEGVAEAWFYPEEPGIQVDDLLDEAARLDRYFAAGCLIEDAGEIAEPAQTGAPRRCCPCRGRTGTGCRPRSRPPAAPREA
jgi:hypothetical protein